MSLFAPNAAQGLYASMCLDNCGTTGTLTFLSHYFSLNSAGESVASYVETLSLTLDIQPRETQRYQQIQRAAAGVFVDINFTCTYQGVAPVIERNRTIVYENHASLPSYLCEVQSVRHYGVALTEIDLVILR